MGTLPPLARIGTSLTLPLAGIEILSPSQHSNLSPLPPLTMTRLPPSLPQNRARTIVWYRWYASCVFLCLCKRTVCIYNKYLNNGKSKGCKRCKLHLWPKFLHFHAVFRKNWDWDYLWEILDLSLLNKSKYLWKEEATTKCLFIILIIYVISVRNSHSYG